MVAWSNHRIARELGINRRTVKRYASDSKCTNPHTWKRGPNNLKAANFRDQRTLDGFDFSFNSSIDRKQIDDLATGRFVDRAEDILMIGSPRVGDSCIHILVNETKPKENLQKYSTKSTAKITK